MKKILVIEDDVQSLYFCLECLQANGFYTIGAENGLFGVQQAKEKLPDLIVCDIIMPQLDGYGVLTTLRQNPDTAIIPFIFLSGKVCRDEIRKGIVLGADDYLTKPCTINELLKAISVQLEKQATLRDYYVAQQSQTFLKSLPAEIKKTATTQSIFPSSTKLAKVFRFIESNYHRPITLRDVAEAAGYSPTYLTNLIGQETGNTVYSWVIKRRMAAACTLLLKTKLAVNQIAEVVGYHDASYFSRQFRQIYGIPPKAWRKNGGVADDFNYY